MKPDSMWGLWDFIGFYIVLSGKHMVLLWFYMVRDGPRVSHFISIYGDVVLHDSVIVDDISI